MDILLVGTAHPLQWDHPPAVFPTNDWGEAQKLLHQFWMRKLLTEFNPSIVFDESHSALAMYSLRYANPTFFKSTGYIPGGLPWIFVDMPLYPLAAQQLGVACDETYRFVAREEYWQNTIRQIASLAHVERVALICGCDHVSRGLGERLRMAGHQVQEHNILDQRWHSSEWLRRPHDPRIVARWIEEERLRKAWLHEQ
jgi:hypothetical protein